MILFQNFLKIKYSVTFKQRKEKLIKKLFTTVFKLLTQKNLKTVIYTHILINETSKVSTIYSSLEFANFSLSSLSKYIVSHINLI